MSKKRDPWKTWKNLDKTCDWCNTKINKKERHYRVELDDGCYFWICWHCSDAGEAYGAEVQLQRAIAELDHIFKLHRSRRGS